MEFILDDGGEHAVQLDARESDCWYGPASYFREKCQQIVEDMAARGRAMPPSTMRMATDGGHSA
jgi:hypothetical protein